MAQQLVCSSSTEGLLPESSLPFFFSALNFAHRSFVAFEILALSACFCNLKIHYLGNSVSPDPGVKINSKAVVLTTL